MERDEKLFFEMFHHEENVEGKHSESQRPARRGCTLQVVRKEFRRHPESVGEKPEADERPFPSSNTPAHDGDPGSEKDYRNREHEAQPAETEEPGCVFGDPKGKV